MMRQAGPGVAGSLFLHLAAMTVVGARRFSALGRYDYELLAVGGVLLDGTRLPVAEVSMANVDSVLEDCIAAGEEDPFGCQVWPSAFAAARALVDVGASGKRVVELGCGPGLPSIAACAAGARDVLATDMSELALDLVRRSAEALREGGGMDGDCAFAARPFDVGSGEPLPAGDVYVAADLLYDVGTARALGRHCRQALDRGAAVLMPQAQLDDEQLANTLINYMNNSELLQQMAERAREQATPNATADVVRACLEVAREH